MRTLKGGLTNQSPSENHFNQSSDSSPTLHHYQTMNWQIRYYNQALQQEIMKLPEGLQARYIHLTKRMMEFGPSLGMPPSRAMREGLFELRLTAKEGQARVFYCTMVNNQIIMLHTFIKKTQKTPTHERELAKRRMREVTAQ